MSKFSVGQRVRCVDDDGGHKAVKHGQPYTVSYVSDDWMQIGVAEVYGAYYVTRFEPIEDAAENGYFTPALSSPSAINNAAREIAGKAGSAMRGYGLPQSSGIPSTARAILDLVPEKKTPVLTERQQLHADNIGRAVRAITENSSIRNAFVMGSR